MAIISWGKPRIWIKNLSSAENPWQELPTPIEGSTSLNTTKGDKVEAKIEGGENEGVRYSKNTYTLALNIRNVAGRKPPMTDNDGLIPDPYAVMLQPENPVAPGFLIDNSTASVEDTFTAADGAAWNYSYDALKPDDGSNQIKWGTVAVGSDGTPVFTPAKFD